MKTGPMSFAMRQLRAEFSRPATWASLVGIGILLAISGAFGTSDHLGLIRRVVYWIVVAILTYGAGFAVHAGLGEALRNRPLPLPRPLAIAISGVATGAVVTALLTGINTLIFGPIFDDLADWLAFAGIVMVTSVVISALLTYAFASEPSGTSPPETAPDARPALLDRLPLEKRGALVAISVEDHYVRVRTTLGEEMLLMRLSDAMGETGETGLQVHRSHWVARAAIVAARREGDRAILTMQHGPEIPVSRRYVAEIKAAGLLPQGAKDG